MATPIWLKGSLTLGGAIHTSKATNRRNVKPPCSGRQQKRRVRSGRAREARGEGVVGAGDEASD
jgi:hypothetical protein